MCGRKPAPLSHFFIPQNPRTVSKRKQAGFLAGAVFSFFMDDGGATTKESLRRGYVHD